MTATIINLADRRAVRAAAVQPDPMAVAVALIALSTQCWWAAWGVSVQVGTVEKGPLK